MRRDTTFVTQTLLVILILNGIILGFIYWLLAESLAANNQALLFWGVGLGITLILWLVILFLGGRLIDRTLRSRPLETTRPVAGRAQPPAAPPAPVIPEPAAAAPVVPDETSREGAAIQMLAILQRKGRLVDFLQEDLGAYQDAQIGAAVRSIHEGCRAALQEHVELEPVFGEAEGSQVTVEPGFDANAIRLSGAVSGEPPFRGILRHRGWQVKQIDLPKQVDGDSEKRVIAPAEVEVS